MSPTLDPDAPPLSPVTRAVYDHIRRECLGGRGVGVRDVQAAFGWASSNAPVRHLAALERAGLITWDKRRAKGLRPAGAAFEAVRVPGGVQLSTSGPVLFTLDELARLAAEGPTSRAGTG